MLKRSEKYTFIDASTADPLTNSHVTTESITESEDISTTNGHSPVGITVHPLMPQQQQQVADDDGVSDQSDVCPAQDEQDVERGQHRADQPVAGISSEIISQHSTMPLTEPSVGGRKALYFLMDRTGIQYSV